MLVMVVFFIAFRWIHLSTPLIRLFLLVLILLLMPTLNSLPVWFAVRLLQIGRAAQQECRDRSRMPCYARKKIPLSIVDLPRISELLRKYADRPIVLV